MNLHLRMGSLQPDEKERLGPGESLKVDWM